MLLFSLAFLTGVIVLQFFSFLPSPIWIVAALGAAILLHQLKLSCQRLMLFISISLLGFAWVLFHAQQIANFTLAHEQEDKVITLKGCIHSLPQVSPERSSFIFKLKTIDQQPMSTLVRLSWPHPSQALIVGDCWQLSAKLKRIHSTMNPGGFDYEAWAFQNGLRASGVVMNKLAANKIESDNYFSFIKRLRQTIQQKVQRLLPATETAPWLLALMIGERSGIPPSQWEVLRNTGTNHLMAIAGLHIGFMSGLAALLTAWLWRRMPGLCLRLPAKEAGACAALLLAICYSALAGFSIPTQRASIMISIYLITTLKRRLIPEWQAWSLALLIVLLLNPLSVLSSSFWLSFVTIALILYGMGGRLGAHNFWWKWGRPQWVIAVGLLPLSLWIFTQYSLVSFLANSIAIPWVGFLLLPLCFLAMISLPFSETLTQLVLVVADKCLSLLWWILALFSQLSFATWQQTMPSYLYLIVSFIGIVLLLAPRGLPGKYLGLFWLLPLLFYKPPSLDQGELKFTLLDVGQGLSAIIQTQHHTLVFDTGARFGPDHDMGESVVLPYLAHEGIKNLDLMIISHGDNDHRGGAAAILNKLPVTAIHSSVPELFASREASYCLRGQSWDWDGVHFSYLNPSVEHLGLGNDSSCTLKVSTAKGSLLLLGDIEKEGEKNILSDSGVDLAADLIVAPHHGSKTSGYFPFLSRVHPQYVFYATGYRNRYHFPHPSVINSYQALGVVQWNTVRTGAIEMKMGKSRMLLPKAYRLSETHYWLDQAA